MTVISSNMASIKLAQFMPLRNLKVTLLFLFVLVAAANQGAIEKYSSSASTKIGAVTALSSDVIIVTQDAQYTNYRVAYLNNVSTIWYGQGAGATSGSFFDKEIKNRVVFSIDHSDNNFSTTPYQVTIDFVVTYKKFVSGSFVSFTATKQLVISNNQTAINKDKAVYEFTGGGNELQVQVTNITIVGAGISLANAKLLLESEIEIERYYYFNQATQYLTADLTHCSADLISKGEIEVRWKNIEGAEEFELEWVHINNYDGTKTGNLYNPLAPTSITFDEKLFDLNSTRISTANNFYRIPYVYERGYILYRVRALGRNSASGWAYNVPGRWSTELNSGTIVNVSQFPNFFPLVSGGCAGANESFMSMSDRLNWQSSITYAEEGKSKAVVNFADATLRSRQTVTKLKSTSDIIIGETIYDFQGRPAINVLPVPSTALNINYVANFNRVSATVPFVKDYFDFDQGSCSALAPPLNVGYGSSNYYSASNPVLTNENKFIPDAGGYPYTQTEYTPDNTGRIRNQSGVGPTHQLGTGRETKYLYGVPEQKDLDRLFAAEVGDAIRYKKNMVIDANGQASISYLDPTGRTIATSLAGTSPSNVLALPSVGSNLTTYDLLNKTNSANNSGLANNLDIPNKKLTLQKTILVPSNGPYTFNYAVTPPKVSENCGATITAPPNKVIVTSGTKCYNCVLDAKISLLNECGNELFSQAFLASPPKNTALVGTYDVACPGVAQTQFNKTFTPLDLSNTLNTAWLKTGSYIIEKSLSVNQNALDLYTKNYLDTLLNPCILKLSDFKAAQNLAVNVAGCGMDCNACNTALGPYGNYSGGSCKICLTQAQYDALKADCDELCANVSDKCENALTMLEADVNPTGQYGQYNSSGGLSNGNIFPPQPNNSSGVNTFPLSVFNESNVLPVKTDIAAFFTTGNSSGFNASFYTTTSSYIYRPDWRHPYNVTLANSAEKFNYLDEFGNIAYVKVIVNGANYAPAVHALHVNKVITDPITGDLKVPVKYLDNLQDFINLWESQWAKSLVAYHPEYCYYEKCLVDQLSNNYDENLTEKDLIVDFNAYLTSTGVSISNNEFMYPVGKPPLTGVAPFSGAIVDPYFASGASGAGQLSNIQTAMVNYTEDPNTPGTYISIWDAAYRTINSPNGGGGSFCNPSSIPVNHVFTEEQWQTFKGMYASLKQAFQERVTANYAISKGCYNACIGAEVFDPLPYQFYNPYAIAFTFVYNPNFFGFWNPIFPFWPGQTLSITNLSQFFNPEQTCNNNKYPYYADKNPRFATAKMLMPNALGNVTAPCYDNNNNIIPCPQSVNSVVNEQANIADITSFMNCGQCPSAVNFEQLLKGLATINTVVNQKDLTNSNTPGVKLTCAPATSLHKEFSNELFKNLFNINAPTNDVFWKMDNLASSGTYLKGKFTYAPSADCNLYMQLQAYIVSDNIPDGTPGSLTAYVPFANPYTFADVTDFCCIKYNPTPYTFPSTAAFSGPGRFSGQVTVLTKSGDPLYDATKPTYRKLTLQGYSSCMDFQNCGFQPICEASKDLKMVQNLLNGLFYSNPPNINTGAIFNTGAVGLTSVPYSGFLQPNLIVSLNNAIDPGTNNLNDSWFWQLVSSANKQLSGYIKPNTATTSQCNLVLNLNPSSSYGAADIKQITGIKPSSVINALPGDFVAYALLRNTGINANAAVWETITGNISCLNAGKCSTTQGGDFHLPVAPDGGCYSRELIVNGDFEQGNMNFYSDYSYDATSNLNHLVYPSSLLTNMLTEYGKHYNVYNVKPVQNNSNFYCISDHTSFLSINPIPTNLPVQGCGNGKALLARSENSTLYYNTALPSDVWFQYVNLQPNTSYNFNAYFKAGEIPGTAPQPHYNGLVLQLYINNVLIDQKMGYINAPGSSEFGWIDAPITFVTGSNGLNSKISIKVFYALLSGSPASSYVPPTPLLPLNSQSDYLFLVDDISLTGCPVGDPPLACDIPETPIETIENDCLLNAYNTALEEAEYNYNFYLDTLRKNFQNRYVAKCLNAYENLTMQCNDTEHHYTLYYYDEAGNLVRTVPPEGVNRLADNSVVLNNVAQDRLNNTKLVFTNHSYATTYKYNSLNQLLNQESPDHNFINDWKTLNYTGVNSGQSIKSMGFYGNNGVLLADNGTTGSLYNFNAATNSWLPLNNLNSNDLNDAVWVSTTTIYAVGKNGTVLKTTNSGTAWSPIPFPNTAVELFRAHQIPNTTPPEVLVYDRDGNTWASSLNGTVWTPATNVLGLLPGEKLVDLKTTQIPYGGRAISTFNRIFTFNGTTWSTAGNGVKAVSLTKVTGDGSSTMYGIGKDGTILKSTNNGLNWVEQANPVNTNIIDAQFYNATNGFIVTQAGTVQQAFLSGASFVDLSAFPNGATNVKAINLLTSSNILYAIDQAGTFKSYDYGTLASSWTSLTSVPTANNNCLDVLSATDIFVGGNAGVLQRFNGTTWTQITTSPTIPVAENIIAIDIKYNTGANLRGYILTNVGKVYRYTFTALGSVNTFALVSGLTGATYTSIYATSNNAAYAVSSNGRIASIVGTAGTVASGAVAANNFKSVYVNTAGNLVAMGENTGAGLPGQINAGTTSSGTYLDVSATVTPPQLLGITLAGTVPYMSGVDGTILKYNSTTSTWNTQITASNTELTTIAATGANNVVAAGKKITTGTANNQLVYSSNAGTTWLTAVNTVDDFKTSLVIGTVSLFGGANKQLAKSATWPPTALTNVAATPAGTSVFNAFTSNGGTGVKAVGQNGIIHGGLSTGTSFAGENLANLILNDVKWFDATHAIAVGNAGKVLVTDDAGANWRVFVPSGAGINGAAALKAVDILNANTAIVVGTNNQYFHVSFTCSGNNCVYSTIIIPNANIPVPTPNTIAYNDISISNGNVIVVTSAGLIRYKPSSTTVFSPIASGVTTALNSVYMVDNTFAFVVGASGYLRKVNPSLLSSTAVTPPSFIGTANLTSVYFKDNLTGYLTGAGGRLAKTTDGGTTWINQTTPSSISSLNTINVVVPNNYANGVSVGGSAAGSGAITDNQSQYTSRFYYDKLGRLIASQNAKQFAKNQFTYSYTKYDDLGRIIEVGEVLGTSDLETLPNTNNGQVDLVDFSTWLGNGANVFTEITKTYYDVALAGVSPTYDGSGTFLQDAFNMRNRVSYTTYQDVAGATVNHATYYNYDIHGNVKTLYQYNAALPAGNKYKRTNYEYDLISGKVNAVAYQPGAADQFYHKYYYDDDNRITNVYTSKDNAIWDQDAKYYYYRHGPLARVEMGDNKVQAMDYAYTLQGWIKGINSDKLVPDNDMGKDGLALSGNSINSYISQDAAAYSLGYYNNDYLSIVPRSANPATYFLADAAGSTIGTLNTNLYNGNISNMTKSIKPFMTANAGQPQNCMYKYDQLNRLIQAVSFESYNTTTNVWNSTALTAKFKEYLSYDANGNIKTLKRFDNAATVMDSLTYKYNNIANGLSRNTNKLAAALDLVTTAGITTDIESGQSYNASNHAVDNYQYDNIGNLIADAQEQIANIEWTVYGKIKQITRTGASTKPDLVYNYDAAGNRVSKIAKTKIAAGVLDAPNLWTYTYYQRDAQGNVMATYEQNAGNSNTLFLTEQHLYGSSRLGVLTRNQNMVAAWVPNGITDRSAGNKAFELGNHLGNLLTVVSDRKIPFDNNADNTTDYFVADILSATDYYAFGAPMPGRQFNNGSYRYGFNGKENDNEVKGTGNQQDYGLRIYDPRLGKFLSVDPLAGHFPWNSTYAFAENKPIIGIDLDGGELRVTSSDVWHPQMRTIHGHGTVMFNLATTLIDAHKLHIKSSGVTNEYAIASFVLGRDSETPVGAVICYSENGQIKTKIFSTTEVMAAYGDAIRGARVDEKIGEALAPVKDVVDGIVLVEFGGNLVKAASNIKFSNTAAIADEAVIGAAINANEINKLSGRTVILDENIWSASLQKELSAEGFNVITMPKGTSDASIISTAKSMNNPIIMTNNVKDFLKQDLSIIKVSENLKKNPSAIVSKMKNLEQNVKSGKVDLNAKNGVSLTNQ